MRGPHAIGSTLTGGGLGRRLAEAVQLWLLPTVGLAAAAAWWHALGVGGAVLTVALAFPALVSTVVVVLGAGVLRLWRFRVPYAVRGVPPWIGLIYAGTLNLAFAAAATVAGVEAFTGALGTAALLGGSVGGTAGIAYDLVATHFRLLDPPARMRDERRGVWATVLAYGPAYFGGMGAVCGGALWAAAQRFADDADGLGLWLATASALGAAPFVGSVLVLAYRRRARKASRFRFDGRPTPPSRRAPR